MISRERYSRKCIKLFSENKMDTSPLKKSTTPKPAEFLKQINKSPKFIEKEKLITKQDVDKSIYVPTATRAVKTYLRRNEQKTSLITRPSRFSSFNDTELWINRNPLVNANKPSENLTVTNIENNINKRDNLRNVCNAPIPSPPKVSDLTDSDKNNKPDNALRNNLYQKNDDEKHSNKKIQSKTSEKYKGSFPDLLETPKREILKLGSKISLLSLSSDKSLNSNKLTKDKKYSVTSVSQYLRSKSAERRSNKSPQIQSLRKHLSSSQKRLYKNRAPDSKRIKYPIEVKKDFSDDKKEFYYFPEPKENLQKSKSDILHTHKTEYDAVSLDQSRPISRLGKFYSSCKNKFSVKSESYGRKFVPSTPKSNFRFQTPQSLIKFKNRFASLRESHINLSSKLPEPITQESNDGPEIVYDIDLDGSYCGI